MIPCQRFREKLFALLDDELTGSQRKELERHVEECTECARCFGQLRRLRSYLKGFAPVRLSEDFQVLLRDRIRRELVGKGRPSVSTISFGWRWIPAFGVFLLLVSVGFWMLDRRTWSIRSFGPEMERVESSFRSGREYDGRIQYVIDDFPSRISVSRTEGETETRKVEEDSLLRQRNLDEVRSHLTPVSF